MKKGFVFITLTLLACQVAWAAKPIGIDAKDAFRRIGKKATVCGVVASAKYLQGSGKEPTFLNFADTYPKHPFTVVVWGEDRDQFDYAPESLKGESICVRGMIEQYKGKPQIVATGQKQIMPGKS
jgi:DNA/RNA endonuclease YhcR with UshA esterase domain